MTKVRHDPKKWASRAASSGDEYAQGVTSPRRPWAASTVAANDNYEAGISEAISENRFVKGVERAGDGKWKKGALDKGVARFRQGVGLGQEAYDRGFRPYVSVIEGVSLPPRGPKGQNYERVRLIGEALREAKKSM